MKEVKREMAQGAARRNKPVVVEALGALNQFKYEMASELNLPNDIFQTHYWGNVPSAQCGAVGGNMVKRMIEAAERSLVEQTAAGVKAGFRAALSQATTPPIQTGAAPAGTNVPLQ